MEESEKRRERLRAMRSEASQAGASSEIGSGFHQLSNPLIEAAVNPSIQANSLGASRFDYYTDPMAAFSNNKRMSKGSYQNSPGSFNRFPTPRNPERAPSSAHQVRPTYSPDPRMHQPQSPYHSPRTMHPTMTPSPAHHAYSTDPRMFRPQSPYHSTGPVNPGSPAHHAYSTDPRMFRPQSPYHSTGPVNPGSPAHRAYSTDPRMFRPQSPYHSSGPVNPGMPLSPVHHVHPPYSPNPRMHQPPRGPYQNSGPRNPNMSPSLSPTHQGQSGNFQPRGPYNSSYANSSPGFRGTPDSERGRSGLGQGSNRGSHGSVSAELRPDLYYDESMHEDPWINLEPSIWKTEGICERFFNTPAPRTIPHSDTYGIKKARISEASKEAGTSQPSLAEYLAAAFNETAGEVGKKEN